MKARYQYRETGRSDINMRGWYVIELLRSDGKTITVSPSRLKQLRQRGQLVRPDDEAFTRTIEWLKQLETEND